MTRSAFEITLGLLTDPQAEFDRARAYLEGTSDMTTPTPETTPAREQEAGLDAGSAAAEAEDRVRASIVSAEKRVAMTDAEFLAEYCASQRAKAQVEIDGGKAFLKSLQDDRD